MRVDGRGEERSDLYYVGTHARYIYYIVRDVYVVLYSCDNDVIYASSMTNAY